MLDSENLKKELDKFKDYVVKESKSNLTRMKKNSSKKLYNSIKGTAQVFPNSFGIEFTMEEYGAFIDKGVNGLKKSQGDTPFSFRKGVPNKEMLKSLDKWIMKRGYAPRNKKGQYTNRKSFKFALARSIFNKGIEKTNFFTKPFEKAFKNLPTKLIEKFGLDVDKLFNLSIKQPKK